MVTGHAAAARGVDGRRGNVDVKTYIVEKPVRVYVINGFEVESNLLWDAVIAIESGEGTYYNDAGNGYDYGVDIDDYALEEILKNAGLIEFGFRRWCVPTPAFQGFYDAMFRSLDNLLPVDDEPSRIWALLPAPADDADGG